MLFGGGVAPTGPPCLEGVELRGFVERVLRPLLPALQQHLAMALNTIKQPIEGGLEVLLHGESGGGAQQQPSMALQAALHCVLVLMLCTKQCR